jgi:hypothetical protein
MTLPNHFATIEESGLDDFSVAMHSVPHVIRDIPWLNEHGRCMDGLRVAPSTITQAGRGAFATRDFRRGQSIYPAPVAHVERQALHMYKDTGDNSIIFDGEQLILNYCYGHPQSSLLLFPYSPVVNYINHNSEPNARYVLLYFERFTIDALVTSLQFLIISINLFIDCNGLL